MKSQITLILIFSFLILLGCNPDRGDNALVESQIEELRAELAPDKRVALWDITFENDSLKGETDQLAGLDQLLQKLKENDVKFTDAVKRLPDDELGDQTRALVTISVANIRSQPKHSAELATQALLGTPLKVLKKDGSWYLVQTPDQYLAWVDQAGVELLDEESLALWLDSPKVVFTPLTGHVWDAPEQNQMVSDLVAGNILAALESKDGQVMVGLPDGRKGWVEEDQLMTWDSWISSRNTNPENLISTAKSMMGVPYLWGGTSIKGVDCSGFTKTIFFLNGQVIPRDASQQVNEGEEIDTEKNWEKLQIGDLLFFGSKAENGNKERVVHVGMWIGNGEFIHSRGRVRISSFDPDNPNYDEYELNRYLRTKRIVNVPSEHVMSVSETLTSN